MFNDDSIPMLAYVRRKVLTACQVDNNEDFYRVQIISEHVLQLPNSTIDITFFIHLKSLTTMTSYKLCLYKLRHEYIRTNIKLKA